MAKRRRRNNLPVPMSPSPADMMRYSAESLARTAMDNHPKLKKVRDEITSEVMKATDRAMKRLGGKKGE